MEYSLEISEFFPLGTYNLIAVYTGEITSYSPATMEDPEEYVDSDDYGLESLRIDYSNFKEHDDFNVWSSTKVDCKQELFEEFNLTPEDAKRFEAMVNKFISESDTEFDEHTQIQFNG